MKSEFSITSIFVPWHLNKPCVLLILINFWRFSYTNVFVFVNYYKSKKWLFYKIYRMIFEVPKHENSFCYGVVEYLYYLSIFCSILFDDSLGLSSLWHIIDKISSKNVAKNLIFRRKRQKIGYYTFKIWIHHRLSFIQMVYWLPDKFNLKWYSLRKHLPYWISREGHLFMKILCSVMI